MSQWVRFGIRVDIELSVALEVGSSLMEKAEGGGDRAAAIDFNQRLWNVVSRLAPTSPIAEDARALAQAAERIRRGDDIARVNIDHARILAGRAATQGSLRSLLADWKTFRQTHKGADFAQWILDRMESLTLARAA